MADSNDSRDPLVETSRPLLLVARRPNKRFLSGVEEQNDHITEFSKPDTPTVLHRNNVLVPPVSEPGWRVRRPLLCTFIRVIICGQEGVQSLVLAVCAS